MNCTCYTIVVRQRICQSGVPLIFENSYQSLDEAQNILLKNGYVLTISEGTNDTATVSFVNSTFGINIRFPIPNNNIGIFDLPIPNGTFRVGIYLTPVCCCN